jgi:hypothetical protein
MTQQRHPSIPLCQINRKQINDDKNSRGIPQGVIFDIPSSGFSATLTGRRFLTGFLQQIVIAHSKAASIVADSDDSDRTNVPHGH